MSKKSVVASLGLAVALLTSIAPVVTADDEDELELEFKIELTGDAERPNPVDTDASGFAEVEFKWKDGAVQWLKFEVEVCDIDHATVAHIHAASGPEAASPPRLFLFGPGADFSADDCERLSSGVFVGDELEEGLVNIGLDAFIDALSSGNAYINVHTTAHPAGEIRGQLE